MQSIRYYCWQSGRCCRYALQGSAQSANNWALIAAAFVGAAADLLGFKMTFAEGYQGVLVSGLIGIGAAWAIIFIVRLVISPFKIWKDGTWINGQFIFEKPISAFIGQWRPEDNDTAKLFRCKGVPPNAFVEFEITFNTARDRIWGNLVLFRPVIGTEIKYSGKGKIRTTSKQQFWLQCYSLPQTVPVNVRVEIIGWER